MKLRAILIRATACLLLGLLIHVAVVLRMATRHSVGGGLVWSGAVLRNQPPMPYVFKFSSAGATDIESGHSIYAGRQVDFPAVPYWSRAPSITAPGSPTGVRMIEFSRGWPCESLYGRRIEQQGMPLRFEGAVPLVAEYKALPLIPIWPAFAVNTLLYALLVLPLTYIPIVRTLRDILRADRIRRGLCPKCAYDLRGSNVDSSACSECGAATRS